MTKPPVPVQSSSQVNNHGPMPSKKVGSTPIKENPVYNKYKAVIENANANIRPPPSAKRRPAAQQSVSVLVSAVKKDDKDKGTPSRRSSSNKKKESV